MDPLDPRHGTQAGRSQHVRDGEEPCDACTQGDLIAGRRRRKRRTMGHEYTRAVGPEIHARLVEIRNQGATYQQIAAWSGVGFRSVYAVIRGGPEERVYPSTHERLSTVKPVGLVTNIGAVRRVQALQFLGYSLPAISAAAGGISLPRLMALRDGDIAGPLNHRVRNALADAYKRLHMTFPDESTTSQRKSVTRARNHARRSGYLPPLAWERIDDPDESPSEWAYQESTRTQLLRDLVQDGHNIREVCRRLKTSREALQLWCKRNDLSALYLTLTSRDRHQTKGAA